MRNFNCVPVMLVPFASAIAFLRNYQAYTGAQRTPERMYSHTSAHHKIEMPSILCMCCAQTLSSFRCIAECVYSIYYALVYARSIHAKLVFCEICWLWRYKILHNHHHPKLSLLHSRRSSSAVDGIVSGFCRAQLHQKSHNQSVWIVG